MDPETRPDPEELLHRVKEAEARAARGALKIFFGAAPGVGKTYAMLASGKRLAAEGRDVIVGCVETHGRAETAALVAGFETLPLREAEHRGAKLLDLDLAAALERRPELILVDELAHTNAPGGVHAKRWQDVMDLLDAGIDVHTTLNVQHVESLNDVVRQVTGVRVRETVPDRLLERADEVELVDLPPDALLQRLSEGKVYVPEQAERAKERFFRRGNLLALRELALRQTAQHVDSDVRAYRREHAIDATWASGERILVAVGPAPASAGLVRAARRMADRLRAPWIAVSVESPTAALPAEARARLDANLALAVELGASVLRPSGDVIAATLLDCARKQNVTRIIIGKPTHSRLRDFLRGSLLDEVVRGSGNIDVLVTNGSDDDARVAREDAPTAPKQASATVYVMAVLAVVIATLLGLLVRSEVDLAEIVMLYLLAIGVVAMRLGRWPSVLAAALAVGALDFFFVEPLHTFAVMQPRHLLTFAMMFVVGLGISGLMLRIRRQERAAFLRAERTTTQYALTRAIAGAEDARAIARVVAHHVEASLDCAAAVLLPERSATATPRPGVADAVTLAPVDGAGAAEIDARELTVTDWAFEHGRAAGAGTDTLAGASIFAVPIVTSKQSWGVVALRPKDRGRFDRDQLDLLDALVRQGALALERTHLAEEARAAALRAKTEELRASLLSAVSHDLRTPLAAITGAATSLLDGPGLPDAQKEELLGSICDEADHLERLLANLLDMTRIESGGVSVKRDWVPVEELVGSALTRLEKVLEGTPIETKLPEDLPLVSVDPVVFAQVFVNLLENAKKYAPGAQIDIEARRRGDNVEIDVSDRGPGIPEQVRARVFEKFYRGPGERAGGVGLGLAICRGIVEAHGGTITVEDRPGGGATFRVSVPLTGEEPPMPEDPPPSVPRP